MPAAGADEARCPFLPRSLDFFAAEIRHELEHMMFFIVRILFLLLHIAYWNCC